MREDELVALCEIPREATDGLVRVVTWRTVDRESRDHQRREPEADAIDVEGRFRRQKRDDGSRSERRDQADEVERLSEHGVRCEQVLLWDQGAYHNRLRGDESTRHQAEGEQHRGDL